MRKSGITYFALFILLCAKSFAQHQDTLRLSEVTFTDYRSKMSKDFSEKETDSVTRANFNTCSIAQLLLQQNACFVKSYGPGNIASLSVRGSTAQQTAVLWNGMNINNPMLGQTDISLLPVGFFNTISLQKGALSGYWGSGAMAGVLNLHSAAVDNGLLINSGSTYSSLKNFSQYLSIGFSEGKWSSTTKLLDDYSENKYLYYNSSDLSDKQTQQHARTHQLALLQDVGFKINEKQQLGVHVWLQDAQRQIPYVAADFKEDANQRDQIFRTLLDWKLSQRKFALTVRGAFFNEGLNYENKTSALQTISLFHTFSGDVEGQYYVTPKITLTAGSSNSVSFGVSQGYANTQNLAKTALFQNIEWRNNKVSASLYGRQELFNDNVFVPTAGFTSSLNIYKWLACKVNAGTIFRYPTLNDLYWNPGGNPDLKAEKGFSEEGSLVIKNAGKKISFSVTGTVFNRNISNWIVWLPGKNGMWSPQNVLEVWSRGGETHSEITYQAKNLKLSMAVLSNYVLSTRTKSIIENDESNGKQLPYVPMYSGSALFVAAYKGSSVQAMGTYTGYRYLSTDNYNYLSPYFLFNLRVAQSIQLKKYMFNVFIDINNVLNETYFSVSQYGMPLRNFKIGINFQFHQPKNKS